MKKQLTTALALAGALASAHADVLLSEGFDNVAGLAGAGWILNNASTPVGLTGWYQGDAGVFAAQAGPAESYAAANYNNALGGGVINNWLITPTFATDKDVTISFWAKADAFPGYFDQLAFGLSLSGSADLAAFTLGTPFVVGTGGWTQYTLHLSAQGVGTQARFAIQYTGLADESNYVGVDTLLVSSTAPVPEPSTWLLLGAGMLGLGAARRRIRQ